MGITRVEWPTLGLAAFIYAAFALLTWSYQHLPLPIFAAFGAVLAAWQSSLQHEIAHGHPTPWKRFNAALAAPTLLLWLPFGIYRDAHLRHHRDESLTDPLDDPESYYVTPEQWAEMGPIERRARELANSFAGRLMIGPFHVIGQFFAEQIAALRAGDFRSLPAWRGHAVAIGLLMIWVVAICGVPFWIYALCVALPGTSLILVRSFLEHQAREDVGHRTVVVEASWFWRLLFLNNNLHAVHHKRPAMAWYRLPALYEERREEFLEGNGGYLFKGYGDVARTYLFRAKEPPIHPGFEGR